MKKYIVFIFIITCFSVKAQDKTVNSIINEVTVFQNGAQINRTASANLQKGHQVICFSDLSKTIDASSIQMGGKGNFTIMSVSYQINYLAKTKTQIREKSITDSLEILTHQLKTQQKLSKVDDEEIYLLRENRKLAGTATGVKIEDIKNGAVYYNSRFKAIFLEQLQIEETVAKINEEIVKLQSQLGQIQSQKSIGGVGEILVELDVKEATASTFDFKYLVTAAAWTPAYNVRGKDTKSPIQLEYCANIYQNTGVEWKNVKLKISTGNPTQNGTIPELSSWFLNYYNKDNDYGYSNMEKDNSRKMVIKYAPAPKQMSEAFLGAADDVSSNYTNVVENQTNTVFEISLPYTISSENKSVNVKVQQWDLPANYRYFTVPKLNSDVFLQARITGWENLSLLSGEVNIFFEDNYVGKSYLNSNVLSDTLNISLGKDKNIIVKRTKINDKNSTTVFGGSKKMNAAWNIEIKNNKNEVVNLVVQDQIPLSREKSIEVTLGEKTDAQYDNTTGFLTWELSLQPKQTTKVSFDYQVKYPKGTNISNLNQ